MASWIRRSLACLLGFACLIAAESVAAQGQPAPRTTQRVLLIQQNAIGASARMRFDAAFVQAIRPLPVELYGEVIEGTRFPGEAQTRLNLDYLAGKYADTPIDVVVAIGVEPLTFMREHGEIFGSPPVVAVLSATGYLARGDDVTGLLAGSGVQGTIELALALRPDTREVWVVDGARRNTGVVETEFRRQMSGHPDRDLIYLRDLPVDEVVARVAAAPDNAIVYFRRQTMRDATEDMEQFEALTRIVRASRVPVFSQFSDYVGHGTVGGFAWQPDVDAHRIAALVQRIAAGERARDIPVQVATHRYVVDWREMQRWSLPVSALPPGTVVLSEPVTIFQQYRPYVVGGTIVFVVQLALIGGLLVQRRRRHRAEAEARNRTEDLLVAEARNSALLRAIPDLMFVLKRDGTYVDYHVRDPAQLFVPPERFMGRQLRDIMPHPLAQTMMEAVEAACVSASADPVIVDYELPMPEPRQYEARLVRVEHDRVLSIVREVTAEKQALALNRALTGHLINLQEDERARIARDLHDGVCQEIASVTLDVGHVRHRGRDAYTTDVHEILHAVEVRTAGILETLRRLSHDLHPSVLQQVGLSAAIRAHCEDFGRRHRLAIRVDAEGDVEPPHRTTALALFRIMQEALLNAVQHGRAQYAEVSVEREDRRLTLIITDDGCGFDVAATRGHGGLGLVSIEERARLAKGQVRIRSRQGAGTTIEADVPFDLEQSDVRSNGDGAPSPEAEFSLQLD